MRALKNKEILLEIFDLVRKSSIRQWVSQKERRKKGAGSFFEEIIAETFPRQGKNWIYNSMKLRKHNYLNTKRSSPRYAILKL